MKELFIKEYGLEAWEGIVNGTLEIPVLDIGMFKNPSEQKIVLTQSNNKSYNNGEREVTEHA